MSTTTTPTHTWRYWIERAEKEYPHLPTIAGSLRFLADAKGCDLDAIAPFKLANGEKVLRDSAERAHATRDADATEMANAQAVPMSDNEDDDDAL